MTDVAGGLITLEYAKTGLGWTDNNTARDADLVTYIQAATPVIESLVGPVLQQTKTILADGGKTGVLLTGRIPNAAAVTAVRVNGGAWSGYTVNADSGVIYAGPTWAGMRFPPGIRNVEVDVTVGWLKTGPASVTLTWANGWTAVLTRVGDIVTCVVTTNATAGSGTEIKALPTGFTAVGDVVITGYNNSVSPTCGVTLNDTTAGGELGLSVAGTAAAGTVITMQWVADPLPGGSPIPPGLQFAARELVRYWVQIGKQSPAGGQLNMLPDSSADPIDPYAIPRRVRQLCAPFAGGGFA